MHAARNTFGKNRWERSSEIHEKGHNEQFQQILHLHDSGIVTGNFFKTGPDHFY